MLITADFWSLLRPSQAYGHCVVAAKLTLQMLPAFHTLNKGDQYAPELLQYHQCLLLLRLWQIDQGTRCSQCNDDFKDAAFLPTMLVALPPFTGK